MKIKIITAILSFSIGISLVYLGFKYFLNTEQLEMLVSKPIQFHIYSMALVVPVFILGGIETFILFRLVYNKNIYIYDILTLPFVVSLVGFLIPFQGSYIYNSIYLKSKYKISLVNTTSIYLVSFSVSFIIAGILGIFYCCFIKYNDYFFLASACSLAHPIFIYSLSYYLKRNTRSDAYAHKEKNRIHSFGFMFFNKIYAILTDYLNAINAKTTIIFGSINIVNTIAFTLWSFWISNNFGFELSFFQLLLLAFFLKFTLLLKFTPGNMGVSELASSAIILILGGTAADGFALSLYQTTIYIMVSLFIGSLFFIINLKHFYFKKIKSIE